MRIGAQEVRAGFSPTGAVPSSLGPPAALASTICVVSTMKNGRQRLIRARRASALLAENASVAWTVHRDVAHGCRLRVQKRYTTRMGVHEGCPASDGPENRLQTAMQRKGQNTGARKGCPARDAGPKSDSRKGPAPVFPQTRQRSARRGGPRGCPPRRRSTHWCHCPAISTGFQGASTSAISSEASVSWRPCTTDQARAACKTHNFGVCSSKGVTALVRPYRGR